MIDYIILGIIQGIFEWFPISSEGITALASNFLIKEQNPVDIAIFLHLGTLLSVIIYFWKDWIEVLTLKNKLLLKFLIISTVISLIVGYPVYLAINNIAIGASLLLLTGFGLLLTSYFHKANKKIRINKKGLAVVAGILQGLSVIPGLSRSGSTIFGLSLGKLTPSETLKYSYMMSAPVVIASSLFISLKNPLILEGWPSLISGFIAGILTLSLITKLSRKINFSTFTLIFAILCFVGAGIIFII